MSGLIDSMKNAKKQLDDKSIASGMLAESKALTSAYFMATLESPTPELRSLLVGAMNQTLDEYAALMDLSLNKNWIKPYDMAQQQLSEAYRQSQSVVS